MSDPLVTMPDARRGLPIRTLCVSVLDGADASLVHRAPASVPSELRQDGSNSTLASLG